MKYKSDYIKTLTSLINLYGYWSNEVMQLNNQAIELFGYHNYVKYHNEVKANLNINNEKP